MTLALVPLALVLLGGSEAEPQARRHRLWLDFAGGPIAPGEDTAAGQATCVNAEFLYPPFLGSGAVADAALAEARAILAPFGVLVSASPPPPELPFTRVRIGATPDLFGLDEQLNGLSCRGIDCGDAWPSDTAFAFSDKIASGLPLSDEAARGITLGRIAVHEAAHAWGLEHAGASDSIMAKFPSGASEQSFVNGCIPLDLVTTSVCPEIRTQYCPEGEQDAYAEMRARFGAGDPDADAPTLDIVAPGDGETFAPGDAITFEVELADARGEVGWSLHVPELAWSWSAPPGETTRDLALPAGALTLRVEAIDADGNVAVQSVAIDVREPDDEPPPPSAACACRSAAPIGALPWLLAIAASPRRRRAYR